MMVEIRMPEVAADMTEADVVDWLAAPGDPVTQGEILFEIETDKSTVEIEAPATGVLKEIRVPAGTAAVPVGELLAVIEASESAGAEAPPAEERASPRKAPSANTADTPRVDAKEGTRAAAANYSATALARRLAKHAGLDIASVQGSGAHGRVLRADIEGALDDPNSARKPADQATAVRAMRARPAKESEGRIFMGTSCRLEKLVEVVDRLNGSRSEESISLEAGLVRAVAMALAEVPELNAPGSAGTAVPDSPTLLTVSRGSHEPGHRMESAERMGLAVLSARLASPQPSEPLAANGLGLLHALQSGVDRVDPSLQPGQVCALGVGGTHESPVVEDGELVAGTVLEINLCADASAVSPELATRFLGALRRILEHPLEMAL